MVKQTQIHKSTKKPLIIAGMLMSLAIIGVGGCGSTTPTSSPTTPVAAVAQPSSSNQQNQGQTAQRPAQNPAQKAAMEISRLQRDQQNALTSDQKAKVKPILQELISTPNPSPAILQQKADAINAVLTDQQKTFLAAPRTPNGNKPNTNGTSGNSVNGNKSQGGTGGKQAGSAPKPQDMYQRILDSLT
jgi:hypothetical protein